MMAQLKHDNSMLKVSSPTLVLRALLPCLVRHSFHPTFKLLQLNLFTQLEVPSTFMSTSNMSMFLLSMSGIQSRLARDRLRWLVWDESYKPGSLIVSHAGPIFNRNMLHGASCIRCFFLREPWTGCRYHSPLAIEIRRTTAVRRSAFSLNWKVHP